MDDQKVHKRKEGECKERGKEKRKRIERDNKRGE